jgi:peptidoglycan hydrolase FlgJ
VKIQNGFALQGKSPDSKAAAEQTDARLKDAARMYESHFLNEMVKAMRSTVKNEDGYVKPNFAEKIFSEQLDQQYVEGWSKKGGVGLADMIYTQIREKYFGGGTSGGVGPGPGSGPGKPMLPIAPKREMHGLGSPDSVQMKTLPSTSNSKLGYRFEVQDPSRAAFEVQAPLPGKIAKLERLDQGWNTLHLDHGQGLISELTFPGHVTESGLGQPIIAGQKLGLLDLDRPVLAWNLDWS